LRSRLERAKHYTTICNAAPSEILARIALKSRDRILERNRAIIAANVPVFESFFAEFPDLFDWRAPDGGCVAYPRYRGPGTAEGFCTDLVGEAGVLLLPPSVYRSELTATPTDRFRVGIGRLTPEPALDAFATWLRIRS
jgi:aspartate/methionine/tyrosine aminotransferase